MAVTTRRRFLTTAAGLVATFGLFGCSAAAHRSSSQPALTSAPVASTSALAAGLRTDAVQVTEKLRSYAFTAAQNVTGAGTAAGTNATVNGRVVLPTAIDYNATLGGKHEEVIRVGGATYVRQVPGAWKQLRKPAAAPDPLKNLLAVLTDLTNLNATADGSTLTGQLPAALAHANGLVPTASGPDVPVNITLDAAHRVTTLSVQSQVSDNGRTLTVTAVTKFFAFDRVTPIRRPV